MNLKLSKDSKKDPTHTKWLEEEYAGKLTNLFEKVKPKLTALIGEPVTHETKPNPKMDLGKILPKVDEIFQEEVIKPAKNIIQVEIPKAYKAGNTFGSIQLGAPLEVRQAEWKKIGDLVLKSESGFQGIAEETATKAKSIIADGMINERKFSEIARDIVRNCDDVGIVKATRDARADIMQAVNQGIRQRYEEAELTEDEMEWLTVEDGNECFPKYTMIMTDSGNKPIQDIKIGDKILTRYGFHRVKSTFKREYSGRMITIQTTTGKFSCTPNHPIYVIGKGWLRADDIDINDLLQTFDEHPTEILSIINIPFSDSYNKPPMTYHESILSSVFRGIIMPIHSINFKGCFRFRNEKIDRIPANLSLLNEINPQIRQHYPNISLKSALSLIFSIARKTTELPINLTRTASILFATSLTGRHYWGSPTFLRTMFSPTPAILSETLSTSGTSSITGIGKSAFLTTNCKTGCNTSMYSEGLPTNRTDLFNQRRFRFNITLLRTKTPILENLRGRMHNHLPANGARNGDPSIHCCVITHPRTIFRSTRTRLERFLTVIAYYFKHNHILLGTQNVYNLCIENYPEYYANDHLVHNCDECSENDGKTIAEIGYYPPEHNGVPYGCRCTIVPRITIPGAD